MSKVIIDCIPIILSVLYVLAWFIPSFSLHKRVRKALLKESLEQLKNNYRFFKKMIYIGLGCHFLVFYNIFVPNFVLLRFIAMLSMMLSLFGVFFMVLWHMRACIKEKERSIAENEA
jgi:uncharacterized membrane protein YqjE